MNAEDAGMCAALRILLAELPQLCAAPDGLYYAKDLAGIQRYKDVEQRIQARLEAQLEMLQLLDMANDVDQG